MQDLQDCPRNPSFRDQGSSCSPVGPCLWALLFSRARGKAGSSPARPSGSRPAALLQGLGGLGGLPTKPGDHSHQDGRALSPTSRGRLRVWDLCLWVGRRRVPSAPSHHVQTATPSEELECIHRETQMLSLWINPKDGSDLVLGDSQRKGHPTGHTEKYCRRVGPGPHVEGAEP